jgi:hypothetical protein
MTGPKAIFEGALALIDRQTDQVLRQALDVTDASEFAKASLQ